MTYRAANQYSTDFVLWATSTGGVWGVAFGFDAVQVRLLNYAGVPLHLNLKSTGAATTDDPEVMVGENVNLWGVVVSGLSLATTSTTTSTGADGQRVVISAWDSR